MSWLADRDLDHGLQIHPDPRLFADPAYRHFDLSEWCLDRGHAVAVCHGLRRASDKPAAANPHPLTGPGTAVASADDDRERALEEHILFQRRPISHQESSTAE